MTQYSPVLEPLQHAQPPSPRVAVCVAVVEPPPLRVLVLVLAQSELMMTHGLRQVADCLGQGDKYRERK